MDGKYKGGGGWKMADGTRGKFTFTSEVATTKAGVVVKEKAVIFKTAKDTMEVAEEWTATNFKNGFFDIEVKGKKAGSGYCGFKQCHLEWEADGVTNEETATFHHGKVYRIGSHTSKAFTVAWQGTMTKEGAKDHDCKKGCPHGKGHDHDHDHDHH